MNNNNWARTLLTVYRYLGRVGHSFDRMVNTTAENSMCLSGDSYSYTNVFDVTDRILNLTERKITLINTKLLIEKVLKTIDKQLARVLIMKYIDCKTSEQVAEHFGFCTRTYFRKINSALDSFSKTLSRFGYDDCKLLDMLCNETWITSVYAQLNVTEISAVDKQDDFIKSALKNNLYKELKSIKCFG